MSTRITDDAKLMYQHRLQAALRRTDEAYATYRNRNDGYPWVGLRPEDVLTLTVAAAKVLDELQEAAR